MKTESKHTPGPWTVEVDEDFPYGRLMAEGRMIAVIVGQHNPLLEIMANARLIAKAPLLEECKAVLQRALACIQSGDVLPHNARADIKQLLAKLEE